MKGGFPNENELAQIDSVQNLYLSKVVDGLNRDGDMPNDKSDPIIHHPK